MKCVYRKNKNTSLSIALFILLYPGISGASERLSADVLDVTAVKKLEFSETGCLKSDPRFGKLSPEKEILDRIQDLRGFPSRKSVKKTFPDDNDRFLKTLAKDTWLYFDNLINKGTQCPVSFVKLGEEQSKGKGCFIAGHTSTRDISLYIVSVVSAYDMGFIKKDNAVLRIKSTLKSVGYFEHYYGFLYKYYDHTSGEKAGDFLSSLDNAFFAAALIVARNAFPGELYDICQEMMLKMDFSFFFNENSNRFYGGFYSETEKYTESEYEVFFTESRLLNFIAVGKYDTGKECWLSGDRVFPDIRGKCENIMPGWSGSMSEAAVPGVFIDEKNIFKGKMWENGRAYALCQKKVFFDGGYWGVSGCYDSSGGRVIQGIKKLAVHEYDARLLSPAAAVSALAYEPEHAVKNIRKIASDFDVYGEYGFYSSVDVSDKEVSYVYSAGEQALILLSINNYLNNGAIRRRFAADNISKCAVRLLSDAEKRSE
ncbi:MAG: glucoamylase family protein [bacterium]|nr:glucoamylase family protein [bacterium]